MRLNVASLRRMIKGEGARRIRAAGVLALMTFGWILWLQASKGDFDRTLPRVTDWERLNTGEPYATLEECEKALTFHADAFEFLIKHRDPDAKRHGKAFVSHDSTSLYGHEFFCLADTVDPPGSKRK